MIYTLWRVVMNAIFGLWFLGGLIGVHPIGVALNTAFELTVSAIMIFYVIVGIRNAVNCRKNLADHWQAVCDCQVDS